MKYEFKVLLGTLLLALINSCLYGQVEVGTGLENSNYKELSLMIESISKDGEEIGLITENVRTKTELRFRSAGIKPAYFDPSTMTNPLDLPMVYLYVNVTVFEYVFSIALKLNRLVVYKVDGQDYIKATCTTWSSGYIGMHAERSDHILGRLELKLDDFLNKYLETNIK